MDKKHEPVKRSKTLTMQKICNAAFEIFSNHEYENASTKKIAERAGVNSALIFNYFGNKRGLFQYILDHYLYEGNATLSGYPHKDNVVDDLKSFIKAHVHYMIERRKILRSMYFLRNYKNMVELDGMYEVRSRCIISRLEGFRAEGKIRDDIDLHKLAIDLLHVADGTISTFSIYSDETAEYTIDKLNGIVELIAAGIVKQPE